MDVLAYRNKFKLLFEQLAEPGYHLDPRYADKLLVKLQATNDPEISKLLGTPFFSDILLESLMHVKTASVSVQAFFLKLIAAVATNELQFSKLVTREGFHLLNTVADVSQTDVSPSIRVAFIEMAISLTTHISGLNWLQETQAWKHIFNLCYQNQTVYVLRAAYKFTGQLLWKLDEFGEEESLIKIFEYILKPIIDSPYHHANNITEEEEPCYVTPLLPSLNTLKSVLQDIPQICVPNILIKLLTKHFVIKYNLLVIIHITRNEEVMLMIAKIIFLLALATTMQNKQDSVPDTILDLSIIYFNTVHLFIQRRLINLLLDFTVCCNQYWSDGCLAQCSPKFTHNNRTIDIQSQVIIIPLVPIICYVKQSLCLFRRNTTSNSELMNNDHTRRTSVGIEEFMQNIIKVSCEHTTRAAYAMRDLILEFDTRAVALQSVKRMFQLKNHLNDAQANIIFQALFYIMIDFVPVDESGNLILNRPPLDMDAKLPILSQVIDVILMLLKSHNINWHESFEIICLYNTAANILRMPCLPTKLTVQLLSLVTLTVRKFIPPNLALLLESRDGSSLHEIADIIYSRMHEHAWEVRDSALELLCECTEIAFIKYTPFQKLIVNNKLISTAAIVAFNDHEFYVQASALRCMAAAAKILLIWDDLLDQQPTLYPQIANLFLNNPEGAVRREAINIMCEIYQHQKVNDNFMSCMYKIMVVAALNDLHWEVQLAALKYWRLVIQNQLNYQGMIDGKFPAVTFSRDKRKIVNLTNREIQKNLLLVLDNLADNGCLRVLLGTLEDDVDVEVSEASLAVAEDLLQILTKYDVVSVVSPEPDKPDHTDQTAVKKETIDLSSPQVDEDTQTSSDKVIDSILDSDDLNLLANIYESQLNLKNEPVKEDEVCYPAVKVERRVSPYVFLKAFRETDHKKRLEERRNWNAGMRSLHSVLDDVLGLYNNEEANTMECY